MKFLQSRLPPETWLSTRSPAVRPAIYKFMQMIHQSEWSSKKQFLLGDADYFSFFELCGYDRVWESLPEISDLKRLEGCSSAEEILLKMSVMADES